MSRPSAPRRRITDLAVIAPLFGFALLVPPVVGLFSTGSSILGAPRIVIYLFGIWFSLIVAAALLAWSLRPTEPPSDANR